MHKEKSRLDGDEVFFNLFEIVQSNHLMRSPAYPPRNHDETDS